MNVLYSNIQKHHASLKTTQWLLARSVFLWVPLSDCSLIDCCVRVLFAASYDIGCEPSSLAVIILHARRPKCYHFPSCQKSRLIKNSTGWPLGVCPLHYTTIFISSAEVEAAAAAAASAVWSWCFGTGSVGSSETYGTPEFWSHQRFLRLGWPKHTKCTWCFCWCNRLFFMISGIKNPTNKNARYQVSTWLQELLALCEEPVAVKKHDNRSGKCYTCYLRLNSCLVCPKRAKHWCVGEVEAFWMSDE